MKKTFVFSLVILTCMNILIGGCVQNKENGSSDLPDRESKIPIDAVKMTPENDANRPTLHSDEWFDPIPLPYQINTAGAEDSAFILPDGNTLYFFFTPDVSVPVEEQVLDGVTGIYVSEQQNGSWGTPKRVLLQEPGKLALDGAECIQGSTMWFVSAREGFTGLHWFTAELLDEEWTDWENADFDPSYEVGELHITADMSTLYFHSSRHGGKGGLDIWVSQKVNNEWLEPENVVIVNSAGNEGWPFVTQDGNELWFSRDYGVWRSRNVAGNWTEPECIISNLAGECSLDSAGNIYFTHHFYVNSTMIEADIYVAYRK
jgi:hypothetical protein